MGRKSISAKHNNGAPREEITKSYASNKKEELMKVINAAKQQLDNVSIRDSFIVVQVHTHLILGLGNLNCI